MQKTYAFVSAGLTEAQQDQVLTEPLLAQHPGRMLPVVRKLLDGMLGIVVIPRHAIVMEKRKQLVLIFEQSRPQCLRRFGAERLRHERLKEVRGLVVVLDEVLLLQPVLVDGVDDRT